MTKILDYFFIKERNFSNIIYALVQKNIKNFTILFSIYLLAFSAIIRADYNYADEFEDNMIFRWDSQIGKANESLYMQDVLTAKRKHLFVKKTEEEQSFYYMGQFDVIESVNALKADIKGKLYPIAKVKMKMKHPVRDDILRYLQSAIE